MNVAIIMAGGSGERFWPLSRRTFPKQLLRITQADESMLQEAVSRAIPFFTTENIYIATTEPLRDAIIAGEPRIAPKRVFAEPDKRNTLGCLVWAACQLRAQFPNESNITMAVLTADHQIGERGKFLQCVSRCLALAKDRQAIVTLGAPPTRPDTGFGYIELDRPQGVNGNGNGEPLAYVVKKFREKPNAETAQSFLESGNFLWNCGMFFWTLETFFNELERHQPEAWRAAEKLILALKNNRQEDAVECFRQLPNISIDYALMEKSDRVCCVPATFPWDDVGCFDSFYRYRLADAKGNVVEGNVLQHNTENCVVLNQTNGGRQVLAMVGVKDLVVVSTDDGLLIVHRDQVQDVKRIVEELKKQNAPQL